MGLYRNTGIVATKETTCGLMRTCAKIIKEIVKDFVIIETMPDETLGLIVCILGLYYGG